MTNVCENKDLYTLFFLSQCPELGCKRNVSLGNCINLLGVKFWEVERQEM